MYKKGDYYFVPPAYAAGGTLALRGGNVLYGALYRNRAAAVVFEDVAVIEGYACQFAAFESVIFAGGTEVSENAFCDCDELRTVRAEPTAAASLALNSFSHCDSLESIVLGEGFASVSANAVYACPSFAGYEQEAGCDKFSVSGGILFVDGRAMIPTAWGGEDVVVPAGVTDLFLDTDFTELVADQPSFRTLVLGPDVQSVYTGRAAFERYDIAGDNPRFAVEDGVLFDGAKQELISWPVLKEAERYILPETVTSIAANAFYGAKNLRNVECPNVVTVGESAFANSELFTAVFGEGLRSIGDKAFLQSWYFEAIEVPETLVSIGYSAFEDTSLAFIELPAGLEKIGSRAFYSSALGEVVLPSEFVEIGEYAFAYTELLSAVLPEGMTRVPEGLFRNVSSLVQVVLPSSMESIGDMAFVGTALAQVELPERLKSIGEGAFGYTSQLESIELPQGLERLGIGAFRGSALTAVALPQALQFVESEAFAQCAALASVTAANSDTVYGEGCFDGTPFLTEGKTAENGGIYLGNTLVALHGGGREADVRYGTKGVLNLDSDTVQVLRLPATAELSAFSFGRMPSLRELWLGEAPAEVDAELTLDVGILSFSQELLVHVPKRVTFIGGLPENIRICYGGSEEDFNENVSGGGSMLANVYFYDAEGLLPGSWHYGEKGEMLLVPKGDSV